MWSPEENSQLQAKLAELRGQKDVYHEILLKMSVADGCTAFPVDLLSVAVTHRAVSLIEGFCLLIEQRNFVCAAPLIRLLLDTLLRFSALWLVEDAHEIVPKLIDDTDLRKIKNREGQFLSDSYLVQKLSAEYPWVTRVYRETSGYIHLSLKHFFNPIGEIQKNSRRVQFSIGDMDSVLPFSIYNEAVDVVLATSKILLRYLYGWAHTKEITAIATRAAMNKKSKSEGVSNE